MRLTSIAFRAKQVLTSQPLYILPIASGGAPYSEDSVKVIRLILHGCANRPFYHISVQEGQEEQYGNVIEQLGTYDPLPNKNNEKLVALNAARLQHWLNSGAVVSLSMKRLLGVVGYFPIHPRTYRDAWFQRKLLMDTLSELEAAAAQDTPSPTPKTPTSGNDDGDSSKQPTSESSL